MHEERREGKRVLVHRPVYYELGGERFRGHLRDLSPAGAFVVTPVLHRENEAVRLCWSGWDGAMPLRYQSWARVLRVETSAAYEGARWPGLALSFEPHDPEARVFVESVLRAMGAGDTVLTATR